MPKIFPNQNVLGAKTRVLIIADNMMRNRYFNIRSYLKICDDAAVALSEEKAINFGKFNH